MRKLKTFELNRLNEEQYKKAEKMSVVVILDNIRSCNNIGSVFRTSDALLVNSLYLCGITACPPQKDIHKTALDAEKTVDWKYYKNTEEAVFDLKKQGYRIYAVEQVENSIKLNDFSPERNEKIGIVFGNEVKGVQQKVVDICDGAIEIPQFGMKHSFNVSISAGIVLWDIFCKIKEPTNRK